MVGVTDDNSIHVHNGWHVPGTTSHGISHGIDAADLPGDHVVGDAPVVHEIGRFGDRSCVPSFHLHTTKIVLDISRNHKTIPT